MHETLIERGVTDFQVRRNSANPNLQVFTESQIGQSRLVGKTVKKTMKIHKRDEIVQAFSKPTSMYTEFDSHKYLYFLCRYKKSTYTGGVFGVM